MPLTADHDEKRLLTDAQVEEYIATGDFLAIIDHQNGLERAEILDRLETDGVRIRIQSTEEPITFTMERPRTTPEVYVIPGKGQPGKAFPARVAIYVAANRDYPIFGGPSWRSEKGAEGIPTIVPVPARPKLLKFEFVRDSE